MHIDQQQDAIRNCRFCFMCRHLSAIGNVTFTEADTPRVRAAMIYGVTQHPEKLSDPDFIDTIYRAELSACCRLDCVSHYDENGLLLAMRQDIVEAGLAPAYVQAIAQDLQKTAAWKVAGKGEVLFFEDSYTAEAKSVAPAFAKLMKAAKTGYATISGGCIGKALSVLGYLPEAMAAAQAFAKAVAATKAKTLVVANPAAYDALVKDFPAWGVTLPCKVQHTSEFLPGLKLKFAKKAGTLYYLEDDFLRNYDGDQPFPKQLLAQLGAKLVPFGTNQEESYCCGEGAVVLPKIDAALVAKLAQYVAERADHPATDQLAVASPYTKLQLTNMAKLNVRTLEEIAADCL